MGDYYKHDNLPWLKDRTILLVKAGSHAYGTNTPTSDLDIRGVAVPTKEYLIGYFKKFEQAITTGDLDITIFRSLDCGPLAARRVSTPPRV